MKFNNKITARRKPCGLNLLFVMLCKSVKEVLHTSCGCLVCGCDSGGNGCCVARLGKRPDSAFKTCYLRKRIGTEEGANQSDNVLFMVILLILCLYLKIKVQLKR